MICKAVTLGTGDPDPGSPLRWTNTDPHITAELAKWNRSAGRRNQ